MEANEAKFETKNRGNPSVLYTKRRRNAQWTKKSEELGRRGVIIKVGGAMLEEWAPATPRYLDWLQRAIGNCVRALVARVASLLGILSGPI
jgi:hypothetical protein